MKYQLITEDLQIINKPRGGYRPRIERESLDWYGAPEGCLYVEDLPRPTETPDGQQWTRAEPTLDGYGWELVESLEAEPVIQPVTKLTIKRRLDTLGKWEAFKALLAQMPAIKDEWDLAQEISADDPMFKSNAEQLKIALSITDEEFNSLLSADG